jgi:hypothetical protein
VDTFALNFAVSRFPHHHFAAVRFLHCSLCLLSFGGLLGGVSTAAVPSAPAGSFGANLSFSVADFDGDSRPDLARVQVGKSDSLRTDYWIQLQLSTAGQQSIRLVAPVGGLRIAARDVNGDESIDLIVSTAWSDRPVAILLNDGHGGFTLAEPASYPQAFGEAKTDWNSVFHPSIDAVGAPPQSRPGYCAEGRRLTHFPLPTEVVAGFDAPIFFDSLLISSRDRAPPQQFLTSERPAHRFLSM